MKDKHGKYSLHEPGSIVPSESVPKPSVVSKIVGRLRQVNAFYIISGFFQMFLGFLVTAVSILNLVQPIWLAAFLSLIGCVVCMLGFYQVYDVYKNTKSTKDLARDAIERAIESRN